MQIQFCKNKMIMASNHAMIILLLAWMSNTTSMPAQGLIPPGEHFITYKAFGNNVKTPDSFSNHDEDIIKRNRSPKKKPTKTSVLPNLLKLLYLKKPTHNAVSEFKPGRFSVNYTDPLGKGAFGKVYRGLSESKEQIAVKVIDVSAKAERSRISKETARLEISEESDLCRQLKHQNILQCASAQPGRFNRNFLYVATELCEEGDLWKTIILKTLSVPEAKCDFWQLLSGLDYMHSRNIVHRDIKPANLFLKASGLLKIGDFGFARRLDVYTRKVNDIKGTVRYMAPEMFSATYDPYAADIWASAITYILSRTLEPKGLWSSAKSADANFAKFKNDPQRYLSRMTFSSKQEKFSEDEVDTLLKMLELDPSKRITAKELMQLSWIKKLKSKCPSSVLSNY